MHVELVRRYPVKSMLGEELAEAHLDASGVAGDRTHALLDVDTGRVATAKHPRLWRALLRYAASLRDGRTLVHAPTGWTLDVEDPELGPRLSDELGRPVRPTADRPVGATVERPDPEDVLREGVEADVEAALLEIGQGSSGTTFVDYAPLHLITTATLAAVGTDLVRYRPNLVLRTPPDTAPFVENDWAGRELRLDGGAVLRVLIPTPRCSVPTLEHGDLPRDPRAVRVLLERNRVEVPGFGVLPCAGVYAEVVSPGRVGAGASAAL